MRSFSYPTIRAGKVYQINKRLNIDQAVETAKIFKEYSEQEAYSESLDRIIKESGLGIHSKPEIVTDAIQDTWEGWVAYSPALVIDISNGPKYEVKIRYSVIACIDSDHSKVWMGIVLLGIAKSISEEIKPAENLSREDVDQFFDSLSKLTKLLVENGENIFFDVLKKLFKSEEGSPIKLNSIDSHLIKAIGIKNKYIADLEESIKEGEIIKLSDEIRNSLHKETALKDLMYFVFNKDIRDVEEYEMLVSLKSRHHNTKLKDQELQPFKVEGLQWFGLEYDDSVALYSREENDKNNNVTYISICSELKSQDRNIITTKKRKASEESSKALVQLVSPFL